MAESRIDLIYTTTGLDKLREGTEELRKQADAYDEIDEAGSNAAKEQIKALDEWKDELAEVNDELTEHVNKQKENEKTIKNQAKELNIFQKGLKSVRESYAKWTGLLSGSVKKLATATTALRVFKVALAATGIGLVVLALGALVSLFSQTSKGVEGVNLTLNKLVRTFQVIREEIAVKVGNAINKFLNEPLESVTNLLKSVGNGIKNFITDPFGTVKSVVKEASEAIVETVKVVDQQIAAEDKWIKSRQSLRDESNKFIKAEAELRIEIEKQRAISQDVANSYDERRKAAQAAFNLENKLIKDRVSLAQQNISVIQAEFALTDDTADVNERLAEAQANLSNIKTESARKQLAFSKQISAINDQELKQLEDLKKSYQDLKDTLDGQIFDLDIESANPLEAIRLQGEANIEALEDQRSKLLAVASDLGIPINDINEQYDRLVDSVSRSIEVDQINRTLEALGDTFDNVDLGERLKKSLEGFGGGVTLESVERFVNAFGEEVVKVTKAAPELTIEPKLAFKPDPSFGESVKDGVENVLNGLEEAFNSDQFAAFQTVFSSVTDAIVSGINTQIAAIDKQIAKQEEATNKTREELEKQEERAEKGLANSADRLEQQLIEEEQQLEESNKRKTELQAEAQRAQLISDSIQQASGLITASANIFKAFSSIPFVGIPLAVAAIATMLGAFAKLKIDAFNATRLESGTKGGPVSDYFARKGAVPNGRTDKGGREGYGLYDRVTGQDMGVNFSGKEPILTERAGKDLAGILEYYEKYGKVPSMTLPSLDGVVSEVTSQNFIVNNGGISKQDLESVMKGMRQKGQKYSVFIPQGVPGKLITYDGEDVNTVIYK